MKNLETKRLQIRKFKMEDVNDVYQYLARDEKLADCIGYTIHKNRDETRKMVASYILEYESGELVWALEEKSTQTIIGYIAITEMSKKNKTCDLKFALGFNWLDTGLLEEALENVLTFLLEEQEFYLVTTQFYDSSPDLTKTKEAILKRVGFKHEAVLRNRKICEQTGKKENLLIFSISK